MSDMPRTAAGRRLLEEAEASDRLGPDYQAASLARILAIEAEAATLDVEALAAAWDEGYRMGRQDDVWRTEAEITDLAAAYAEQVKP